MKVNDFDCNALCDLGASISIMPRKIYDMLGLPPLENCYLDVPHADIAKKKPLGRIMMFLLWLTITLSPLISLFWILNAMLLVLLFWEDLFLELLVLLLIRKKVLLDINSHSRKVWNTFLEREKSYLLILLWIYQTGIPMMQSHTGKPGWPMDVVWRIANWAA
jgi:hypothetical protein